MPADLARYITELKLDKYRDFLLGIARPSIEILDADVPVTRGCSKFGGSPDVPADFKWPIHKFGPYRFVGQFNPAEVPKGSHGLPESGLLSFFYAEDENGESFWQDPDYVRVFRFEDVNALKPIEPPTTVRGGSTSTLKFEIGMDIPPWPWDEAAEQNWPLKESDQDDDLELKDAYWELRLRLHPSHRYLLGYPFNTTLAYDPRPGPEWRSLLTLDSNDELLWCWHDGDWLVTFIEEHRLRTGDFSHIKSDAG